MKISTGNGSRETQWYFGENLMLVITEFPVAIWYSVNKNKKRGKIYIKVIIIYEIPYILSYNKQCP